MAAFAHDVFVSYARADDEPPLGGARGWVTTLADELRKLLRRKLGAEARVFMDHQLASNEGLPDRLLEAIRGSRTLVLVMSNKYLKSRWCQWELGRFLESKAEQKHRHQVLVVETEPLDREGWPPRLQELTPIRFWYRKSADEAPRLMGFPAPKLDEENPYWRNLNDLAHLIASQLEVEGLQPQVLYEYVAALSPSLLVDTRGQPLTLESIDDRRIIVDESGRFSQILAEIKRNPDVFYQLTPRRFEEIVCEILRRFKYEVELTPASKDGGFDIRAERRDELGNFVYLVECKRFAPPSKVGVEIARSLYGVVESQKASAGAIVTSSFFTTGAKSFCATHPNKLALHDFKILQKWVADPRIFH